MAFTTLEERFNQSARDIYSRFSNNAELVTEIKPDTNQSRSRIKDDVRGLPIVSTQREATRISKFIASNDGQLFIATQGTLNTQSTFKTTIPISLKSLAEIFTSLAPFGLLSFTTRTSSLSNGVQFKTLAELANPTPTGAINSITLTSRPGVNIDRADPIKPSSTLFTFASHDNNLSSYYARPEDVNGWYPSVLGKQSPTEMSTPRPLRLYKEEGVTTRFIRSEYTGLQTLDVSKVQYGDDKYWHDAFSKYVRNSISFNLLQSVNQTAGYIGYGQRYADKYNISSPTTNDKIYKPGEPSTGTFSELYKNEITYDYITGIPEPIETSDGAKVDSDIIKFIFTDANGANPIHFRAFISSIKEQVKPEFSEQRYVGRIERFVTYSGVKRSLSLQFNVVAFSAAELRNMWLRINSLTGRAFPKGISYSGFMAPPLFKITIGNLYDNQPCYIDSLDYDFLDESITFDVDTEMPHAINVSLSLTLLEKRTKKYNSPFYAFTEAMQGKKERVQNIGTPAQPTPEPQDIRATREFAAALRSPEANVSVNPPVQPAPPRAAPTVSGPSVEPGGTTPRPASPAAPPRQRETAAVNAKAKAQAGTTAVAAEAELTDFPMVVAAPARKRQAQTAPNRSVNPSAGDRPRSPFINTVPAVSKPATPFDAVFPSRAVNPKNNFVERGRQQGMQDAITGQNSPTSFAISNILASVRVNGSGQFEVRPRGPTIGPRSPTTYQTPRTLTDGTQILSDGTIVPPDKFGRPQPYRLIPVPGQRPRVEVIRTDGGIPAPPSTTRRTVPARAGRPARIIR